MHQPNDRNLFFRHRHRAFSIVEVMIAMGIMTIMMATVLAAFVQTRRLAASSVAQSCAVTIVQGYIEQLKNLPLQQFVNANPTDPQDNPQLSTSFTLPTMKDPHSVSVLSDGSIVSTVTLNTTPSGVATTTLTGGTPGVTPAGVIDNFQSFDMDSRNGTLATTWAQAWPGGRTFPSTIPGRADLRMNFWVQITDLTPTSSAKCKAYGILIVYTWQYINGGRIVYNKDSVRTVRSAVQTF